MTRRKLDQINEAVGLDDLRVPPSNLLEASKGTRKGQYSIRINGQYRLCFFWIEGGDEEVEVPPPVPRAQGPRQGTGLLWPLGSSGTDEESQSEEPWRLLLSFRSFKG